MKVTFLVTHLLGSGHLSRALTLGRGFAAAGHDVRVISGGMPVAHLPSNGITLVQLPPLRSDGVNFTQLLDRTGNAATPALFKERTDAIVADLHVSPPDVLITELFPFGRRTLKAEFEAVLSHAAHSAKPPMVLASIRDILAPPSKPAKADYAEQVLDSFYAGVLVHADAEMTPLSLSWPVSENLSHKLHYTGFVAPPPPTQQIARTDEILVSAGGGDVGTDIFRTALEAARLAPELRFRLLVGGSHANALIRAQAADAPTNAVLEPARPDFRTLLTGAAASLSMCGYNTALDVLQAGVPAVFVPFDAGGEVEQSLRAQALAQADGIAVVQSADMTAHEILRALRLVMSAPARHLDTTRFLGVENTVRIVEDMVAS